MWARIVNTVLGLWLMVAPAILGHQADKTAASIDHIIGPLVGSLAVIAMCESVRPMRWGNVALGLLLVALHLVLGSPGPARLNALLVGPVIAACASVRGPLKHSLGGGWSWLWGKHAAR